MLGRALAIGGLIFFICYLIWLAVRTAAGRYGLPTSTIRSSTSATQCLDYDHKNKRDRYTFINGKCVRSGDDELAIIAPNGGNARCAKGWRMTPNDGTNTDYPIESNPVQCKINPSGFYDAIWVHKNASCGTGYNQETSHVYGEKRQCSAETCPIGFKKEIKSGLTYCDPDPSAEYHKNVAFDSMTCPNPDFSMLNSGKCWKPCRNDDYAISRNRVTNVASCRRRTDIKKHNLCNDNQDYINDKCFDTCPDEYDVNKSMCIDNRTSTKRQNYWNTHKIPFLRNNTTGSLPALGVGGAGGVVGGVARGINTGI